MCAFKAMKLSSRIHLFFFIREAFFHLSQRVTRVSKINIKALILCSFNALIKKRSGSRARIIINQSCSDYDAPLCCLNKFALARMTSRNEHQQRGRWKSSSFELCINLFFSIFDCSHRSHSYKKSSKMFSFMAKSILKLSEIYVRFPFKMMLCVCLQTRPKEKYENIL